ncbi:MAG TPA: SMP-30/gluconolactonase/LRE family protein [Steroidobacteraceae bacterium]|nr:SMP-30/gluconolactonase/LRE family protein [Steroidobacteraceae bacterium]
MRHSVLAVAALSLLAGALAAGSVLAQDSSSANGPTFPPLPALTPHGVGMRAQPAGSGVQAPSDVREALVKAACKQPPPPPAPRANFARRRDVGPFQYSVQAIPGVVDAGVRWKLIWTAPGNNADGMVGLADGSVLAAQNDTSRVVRISPDGHASIVYEDTDTGGSLAINKMGQLFIGERSLIPSVWELWPQRKLIADAYHGEPLECQGAGVMDSVVALHNGGVYFGFGGTYYASPDGQVTRVFDKPINDAVLSPDESKLYLPSGGDLYVADVGADGMLSNAHVLAHIPGGGNDGGAVDADGRIYVSGFPGVRVFEPNGHFLGTIPAPREIIDIAFAGPDKKTLFAISEVSEPGTVEHDELFTLQMVAQGYLGRGK